MKSKRRGGKGSERKKSRLLCHFQTYKLSRNFAPAHAQTLEAYICIWNIRPRSASLQMALGKF